MRLGESIRSIEHDNSDEMCFSESAAPVGPGLDQQRDTRSNHSSQIKSGGSQSLTGGHGTFGKPRLSLNLNAVLPSLRTPQKTNNVVLSNRSNRLDGEL